MPRWIRCGSLARSRLFRHVFSNEFSRIRLVSLIVFFFLKLLWLSFLILLTGVTNMDSDPSLSCSDTGDGYPLSDLSDSVTLPGLMGPEDLAATLVALKEAPELNRLVQDVVEGQQSVAVPQGM